VGFIYTTHLGGMDVVALSRRWRIKKKSFGSIHFFFLKEKKSLGSIHIQDLEIICGINVLGL